MRIVVMEKVPFSEEQKKRLSVLASEEGVVEYYDYGEDITYETAREIIRDSDVVVVNWIDPSPFLLSMKSHSMVALLSTGYGWIQGLQEARRKDVLVSNIPAYSTEAVAEHVFGLLLTFNKRIMQFSNWTNSELISKDNVVSACGVELKNKTLGIIGLGNIGSRIAEIATVFGMNIITYNRTQKNSVFATDVSFKKLLSDSDVICVSCPLNSESKSMINNSNIEKIKGGAIITGATWGVIDEMALETALCKGDVSGAAFDLALEGNEKLKNSKLLNLPNFLCTFHNAYNTVESQKRQMDICIDNIESFFNGKEKNVIN